MTQPGPQRSGHLLRTFLPELWAERSQIVGMAVLLVLSLPPAVAAPMLLKRIFDDALPSGNASRLLGLSAAVVGLATLSQLGRYVQGRLSVGLRSRARYRLTRRQLSHLLRLPLSFYHRNDTRYLLARLRDDVTALEGLLPDAVLAAALDAIKALIFLILLFVLDAVLALAALTLVIVLLSALALTAVPMRRRGLEALERASDTGTALHDLLAGVVSVRTNVQENRETRRAARFLAAAERSGVRRDVLTLNVGTAVGLVGVLGIHSILSIGAYRVMVGSSTVGTLMSFFLILTQLVAAADGVLEAHPRWQKALAALGRIAEILAEPTEEHRPSRSGRTVQGGVDFEEVSFAYTRGRTVLNSLAFSVRPGETVALVGRSGAGKSSLVQMIPALLRPTGGRIRIGGRPIDEIPLDELRAAVGLVPQETYIFNRSVRENIAFASPHASEPEIRRAARAACAEDFILGLPEGYATNVGERGVRLSGGQRQRLAIAREILRDPPILILDEAMAALDSESEARIRIALGNLKTGRTCFLIAHRLATVVAADRIAVLDEGRLGDIGTHRELFSRCALYRRLCETQLLGEDTTGSSENGLS